jgi:hypothetical protein
MEQPEPRIADSAAGAHRIFGAVIRLRADDVGDLPQVR